jgi:thiamine-phosphate pyrophosphorylase
MALEGGCRWIQLRMKDAGTSLIEDTAIVIQKMCKDYGATFIVDDHVLLAKKINADGVHLGKNDMPICEARRVLGEGYIIGATVNSFEDVVRTLQNSTPDYFGCGPYRYTSTKQNLAPILGTEGYREIVDKMRANGISIPLVAIGGITKSDIPELLLCGVDGIALSGSIINAENPVRQMREVAAILLK